jgi:hypothetical protein
LFFVAFDFGAVPAVAVLSFLVAFGFNPPMSLEEGCG